MSDYAKSYNGAAKDLSNDVILGADFDTEFQAIETAVATKSNKVVPAATGNVATLSASGDLVDSTVTSTELGFLDGATAGTQVASKAVIADANINTGISKVTELHIGASGSEVQVTATPAELNTLDGITATVTELNYTDGVTSPIQDQLNARTLVKIVTTTVAAPVASVSFQDGVGGVVFDSTYDAYLIQLVNVVTDTDGIDLQARVYVGGVLQTGAAAYDAGGATAAQMTLASSIGNAVGEGIDSMIYIYNPAGTTRNKRVRAENIFTLATGFPNAAVGAGEYNSTSAIDGFQLYASAGNISGGIFRLYGVSF